VDLRVWFAAHELVSRRQDQSERRPRYTAREIEALTGIEGATKVRSSLKRLRAVGLVRVEDGRILFPERRELL